SNQNQRDFGLTIGMLDRPGNPANDVFGCVLIVIGDHLLHVLLEARPVSLLRFDTPAFPCVQTIVNDFWSGGLEGHATILPAPRITKPKCPQCLRPLVRTEGLYKSIRIALAEGIN